MTDLKKINEIFQDLLKQKLENNPAKPSKPTKQKLSKLQIESLNRRLDNLLPQFKKAIQTENYQTQK